MSGPSFENIDRWLFEYVEGNLTQEQERQLEAFLLDHPEFDLDLDSWQMAKVEPVSVEFPNQEMLYRKEKKRRRIFPYVLGFSAITTVVATSILLLLNSDDNLIPENHVNGTKVFKSEQNNLAKNDKSVLSSKSQNQRGGISKGNMDFSTRTSNDSKNSDYTAYTNKNISIDVNSTKKSLMDSLGITSLKIGQSKFIPDSISLSTKIPEFILENELPEIVDSSYVGESVTSNEKEFSSEGQSIKGEKKKISNSKSHPSQFSFKNSLKNLNDFMGNDVGLKNTKDHQIHIPGMSQLDVNFSSAGDISSTRFRTVSRAQWLGRENQSFTNQLAFDWYSKSLKSGFGLQGNYQVYGNGVIQNWNTALIYSPKILLSRSFLIEPGVRFKMGSKILTSNLVNAINKVEVERENSIDFYADGSSPIGTNQWYRDLGTSLLIHSKWFYIGFQADNLLRHQDNIYSNSIDNPRRAGIFYSVNFGTEYESKTGDLSFSPYGYYEKFENREETWGGFNFQYKSWSVGGALSNKSNFALSSGLRLSTFAITYQFDQTYSSLLGSSASSHQLTIMFNTKVSRSSRRYIQLK